MRRLTKDELKLTEIDIKAELEKMGAYAPYSNNEVRNHARVLRERFQDLLNHIKAGE